MNPSVSRPPFEKPGTACVGPTRFHQLVRSCNSRWVTPPRSRLPLCPRAQRPSGRGRQGLCGPIVGSMRQDRPGDAHMLGSEPHERDIYVPALLKLPHPRALASVFLSATRTYARAPRTWVVSALFQQRPHPWYTRARQPSGSKAVRVQRLGTGPLSPSSLAVTPMPSGPLRGQDAAVPTPIPRRPRLSGKFTPASVHRLPPLTPSIASLGSLMNGNLLKIRNKSSLAPVASLKRNAIFGQCLF